MEEVVDMEADFSDRLEDFAQRLDDSARMDDLIYFFFYFLFI